MRELAASTLTASHLKFTVESAAYAAGRALSIPDDEVLGATLVIVELACELQRRGRERTHCGR